MKSIASAISVGLFYLGAITPLLARFSGIRMQEYAARLSDIVITAILFLAARVAMSGCRGQRFVFLGDLLGAFGVGVADHFFNMPWQFPAVAGH